nr:MAG TPA: hypothetical protein [Caudoviricetes sp.]
MEMTTVDENYSDRVRAWMRRRSECDNLSGKARIRRKGLLWRE